MKRFKALQIFLAFMMLILSFLITGCGSNGQTGHWLPARTLTSIMVTPVTASVPVSGNQQFTAIATYSDGTSIDVTTSSAWISSNTTNASVNPASGWATGNVASTSSVITATYNSMSGSATLNVSAATHVSFVVIPATASIPVTGTQQYTAIETFSDGTTQDRTLTSTWTASGTHATISITSPTIGVATGASIGQSTITATYAGSPHSPATAILTVTAATPVSLIVTPATASVVVGGTQQYAAIEIFSDGSNVDVTQNVNTTWSAVDIAPSSGVASILPTGVATGLSIGTSTITAVYGGYTGTAVLTVTAPTPGPAGAVDLKTAGTYAIMANSKITLSTPSTTHIYGDVGILAPDTSTPYGFVGFSLSPGAPPTSSSPTSIYVTGQITSGPSATTGYNNNNYAAMVQAFNDLNAAWTANNPTNNPAPSTPLTPPLSASPLPAGGTFTASAQDLSGLLLGPGIYASSTPTDTLALSNGSGSLVLDAGGNPDAVFIFQASDITTTTGSVILRNGAQAKNVYWVLTFTATIGTDTVFQGNILAGTTVTVNVGASVEGRVLAGASETSGALTIKGGIITTP